MTSVNIQRKILSRKKYKRCAEMVRALERWMEPAVLLPSWLWSLLLCFQQTHPESLPLFLFLGLLCHPIVHQKDSLSLSALSWQSFWVPTFLLWGCGWKEAGVTRWRALGTAKERAHPLLEGSGEPWNVGGWGGEDLLYVGNVWN